MSVLVLPALNGTNPLGFFAALGTLGVLERRRGRRVQLSWSTDGLWQPTLHGLSSVDDLIEHVLADLEAWERSPVLALTYEKNGKRIADLKPPPEEFRGYLENLRADARVTGRRELDLAAAFAPEGGLDNNGQTKPTAFHFSAGQQLFLRDANKIRANLERADIEEALQGPWRYERTLPVLGWDLANDRTFALRATDPSKEKKTGVPGADWLALLGLAALPTFVHRGETRTTGCGGSWKRGHFTWPLWSVPIPLAVVKTLVGLPLAEFDAAQRAARGIAILLRAPIHRSDQGGYGNFGPGTVLP